MTSPLDHVGLEKCPLCSASEIIEDHEAGEYVCGGCGLVLGRVNPYRGTGSFNGSSDGGRGGRGWSPLKSTLVGYGRDRRGTRISRERVSQIQRIRRWQEWSGGHRGRNLSYAVPMVGRVAEGIQVPSYVRREAERLYRRALDLDLVRGRNIDEVVAACVYAACRLSGVPRSLGEICKQCSLPWRDVARGYRLVHDVLGLDPPNPDPRTRVSRIAEVLGIGEKVRQRAVEILSAAKRGKTSLGRSPVGLAAGALFLACRDCGVKVTQKAVAEAAGVAGSTLRNNYRGLEKSVEEETG